MILISPAWPLLNIHTPMISAIGTVMPMVNTPHGLFASALTTTMPSPASVTSRMNSTAIIATSPAKRTDLGPRDVRQRAPLVPHRSHQHREVLHASRHHRADQQPEKPGRKAKLRRQRGTHQRSSAGDRGKVVPEQNPFRRGHIVMPVFICVCGSDAAIIQHHRLGGDKCAVVPVS